MLRGHPALHILLVEKALKLLGTKIGNAEEISGELWAITARYVRREINCTESAAKLLIKTLNEMDRQFKYYIAPNVVVDFRECSENITIGPVRLISAERLAMELNGSGRYLPFVTEPGDPTFDLSQGGERVLRLAPSSWCVKTNAAMAHVAEEATWNICVALSLLRLLIGATFKLGPKLGDVEPHPIYKRMEAIGHITLHNDSARIGGKNVPSYYVSEKTIAGSQSVEFIDLSTKIFSPRSKSVAERLERGLGWLAKGRQAQDRPERLLFFFTAIEALLTGDDKTVPIIQTVARHASTILDDDPLTRSRLSSAIKKLYARRSALVHSGNREISHSDCLNLQKIAESVSYQILTKVDLNQSAKDFQTDLEQAGFGLVWNPRKEHL